MPCNAAPIPRSRWTYLLHLSPQTESEPCAEECLLAAHHEASVVQFSAFPTCTPPAGSSPPPASVGPLPILPAANFASIRPHLAIVGGPEEANSDCSEEGSDLGWARSSPTEAVTRGEEHSSCSSNFPAVEGEVPRKG